MKHYPRIREARKAKNWTQAELAKKAGVSEIAVRSYENRKRTPAVEIAVKLARALGVTMEWLFGDDPSEMKIPQTPKYPRIREARLAAGLTQAQLAEKADVSRVSIGFYERGERIPPLDAGAKIAKVLNVSLDWLVD